METTVGYKLVVSASSTDGWATSIIPAGVTVTQSIQRQHHNCWETTLSWEVQC